MNPLDKWDDWEWERAAQDLARPHEEKKRVSSSYSGGYRGSHNGNYSASYRGSRSNSNPGFAYKRYAKSKHRSSNFNLGKWSGGQRRVVVAAVFFLLVLFSSYGADKVSQAVYNAYQMGVGSDSYPVISNMITDALGLTGGDAVAVDAQSRIFYPPVAGTVKLAFKAKNDQGKASQGVCIGSSLGTNVYCPGTGVVMEVSTDVVLGHFVRIKHDDGWESVIANLGDVSVVKGDPVEKGGIVGTVGSSASHRNPWVYLELRKNSRALDPLLYLQQGETT